jgi:hypothetical protein
MKTDKIEIEIEKLITLDDFIKKTGNPFESSIEKILLNKKDFKELEDNVDSLGSLDDINNFLKSDIKFSKYSQKYPCAQIDIKKALIILEKINIAKSHIKNKRWIEAIHECLHIGIGYGEYTILKEYKKAIVDRVSLIRANPKGIKHRKDKFKYDKTAAKIFISERMQKGELYKTAWLDYIDEFTKNNTNETLSVSALQHDLPKKSFK